VHVLGPGQGGLVFALGLMPAAEFALFTFSMLPLMRAVAARAGVQEKEVSRMLNFPFRTPTLS